MDPAALLTIFGRLGAVGALAVVAYLFWDKSRRIAQAALAVFLLATIVISVPEVMAAWASYTVSLLPPTQPRWGGIYDTGESVERISAVLMRNGESTGEPVVVDGIDIANRELRLQLDTTDDSRMLVSRNSHQQGYVPLRSLDGALRDLISSGAQTPYAIGYTGEAVQVGASVTVSADSAVRAEFESVTMRVLQWNYQPAGVVLDIQVDGERVVEGLLTRDRTLTVATPDVNLIVGLLVLDLADDRRRRARFVLLKYL